MAEQFGRHMSTRWTKAAVPSYGDEWGDDDYGNNSSSEEEIVSPRAVVPERFELPGESSEPTTEPVTGGGIPASVPGSFQSPIGSSGPSIPAESPLIASPSGRYSESKGRKPPSDFATPPPAPPQNPGLVLSIDRFKNRPDTDSDETSDEEHDTSYNDEAQPQTHTETFSAPQLPAPAQKASTPPALTLKSDTPHSADVSQYQDTFIPPTPTYSEKFPNPETPQSDRSYQSDADSIQHETDLNVVDSSRFVPQPPSLAEIPEKNFSSVDEFYSGREETDHDTESVTSKHYEPEPEHTPFLPPVEENSVSTPLVLSIDKRNFEDSSDDDDDDDDIAYDYHTHVEPETEAHQEEEDDWGYNSQHSSNESDYHEEKDQKELQESHYEPDSRKSSASERRRIETTALDSLIHDLQHASIGPDDSPERSYDTEDNSYALPKLDSFNVSLPDFEGKSFQESDAYASQNEDQVNSPTTPIAPLSTSEERDGHENYLKESGYRRSIRKPPPTRANLVSVDYSNIADAVSGYLDNEGGKNLDSIGEDDSSIASEDREPVHKQEAIVEDNEEETRDDSSLDDVKRPDNELQPVTSLGSLSTGKFSFETSRSASQRGDNHSVIEPDDRFENTRRVSTMSTGTFNMGGWNPNTNNYRDQFINDNDNESQINFNPHSNDDAGYNRFTKVRTASGLGSEVISNSSSISVPETIDAALPSINEDPDNDNDNENDDQYSYSNSHDTSGLFPPKTNALKPTVSAITNPDSVLGDHSYPSALFKEERMTPAASRETLPKNQRYSSLFSPTETDSQETKRVNSDSSITPQEKDLSDMSPQRVASSASDATTSTLTSKKFTKQAYPVFDWKSIMATSQPIDRIRLLKIALEKETEYDTGIQNWLVETLKSSEKTSDIHIGKIAEEAYSNATHNDIRRGASLRSRVSIVKDKVETSGLHASSFGKRFLSRGKKFMKGGAD